MPSLRFSPIARFKPSRRRCTAVVPRKAKLEIQTTAAESTDVTARFYEPTVSDVSRPIHEIRVRPGEPFWVPASFYVLSVASRRWAPDLHLLDATPGSEHTFQYRRRDGWSTILRTVADRDGEPVSNAQIEVDALPGFYEPAPDSQMSSLERRQLLKLSSDSHGLAVASGLVVPFAAATVRHQDFLKTEVTAFPSGSLKPSSGVRSSTSLVNRYRRPGSTSRRPAYTEA